MSVNNPTYISVGIKESILSLLFTEAHSTSLLQPWLPLRGFGGSHQQRRKLHRQRWQSNKPGEQRWSSIRPREQTRGQHKVRETIMIVWTQRNEREWAYALFVITFVL